MTTIDDEPLSLEQQCAVARVAARGESHDHVTLSLAPGEKLPTEFRLFTAGWNDTENGRYLFDEEAAASVMSAYAKWGVDLAIDLEHQMLDPEIAPDSTAKDARGWCSLELRPDGSLWAVSVSWTADGAARLAQKRQRYISPAFSVDPETSRVVSIINVAITAIPATHRTPALVAAHGSTRACAPTRKQMDLYVEVALAHEAAQRKKMAATPSRTPAPKAKTMTTQRLAASPTIPGANLDADPKAQTKIAAIAKILGVDAGDYDALDKAWDALWSTPADAPAPSADAATARKFGMTLAAVARCRAKGLDPAAIAKNLDAIAAKSPSGLKR